jgi:Tol biopolymer transport system component
MNSTRDRRKLPLTRGWRSIVVVALASICLLAIPPAAWAFPALTVRASVSSAGEQGLRGGERPAVSHTGRFVAFETDEAFDPSDTNFKSDIYLRDLSAATTSRVSLPPAGGQFPENSSGASISADGDRIAFLVENPTEWEEVIIFADRVFVRDVAAEQTVELALTPLDGEPLRIDSAAISADGTVVLLNVANALIPEDSNAAGDVYVYVIATGAIERVSVASDGSEPEMGASQGSISGDGQIVAFTSSSSNLVPGDTLTCGLVFPPVNCQDLFLHNRSSGETVRISLAPDGAQANDVSFDPVVSADGRHVAFSSAASNLVPGDANQTSDAFVFDVAAQLMRRASVSSAGAEGNNASTAGGISASGDVVAFRSAATNLDPAGRRGIFIHRFSDAVTVLASLSSDGQAANASVAHPTVSGDATFLTFDSSANNLVPNDTNGAVDVFVRSLSSVATEIVAEPVVASVPGGLTVGSFKARLTTADGSPLTLRRITFSVGSTVACTATTNLDGVAVCGGTAESISAIANLGYTATFAGEWPFEPAEGSGSLVRVLTTTLP